MFNHSRYDAMVVGARCAGAATAMLMARCGLKVLVIDRGRYGADTTSTHALMRGGVMQLHRWGLLPRIVAAGTPAVRSTEFHYGEDVLEVDVRPRHGVEALYAPRRTLLDSTLVDAARAAGAEVRHGCTLAALVRDPNDRVSGAVILDADGKSEVVTTDLVVGGDGIGSAVARLIGAHVLWEGRHASSVVYGHCSGLVRLDIAGTIGRASVPASSRRTAERIACSSLFRPSGSATRSVTTSQQDTVVRWLRFRRLWRRTSRQSGLKGALGLCRSPGLSS